MPKLDPIRDNYYRQVELADKSSDWLFYLGATLSLLSLFIDQTTSPRLSNAALTLFCLDVVALLCLSTASRLYLTPRAEDRRRQDFLSNAFGVSLTHVRTEGYYNNDQTLPIRRLAAQTLENSLFSKTIALRMARRERTKIAIYATIWILVAINRQVSVGVILAISQVIFSEQILAKFLRLEWLRNRFEHVYENTYRLFQTTPRSGDFNACALELLTMYETTKATASITLDSRDFSKINEETSAEWESIKTTLHI
ncbi:hypothetical protein [Lysobacter enzymogenes]|uniref:hypothetical protein n=1 Tax=Lysobacter enzymogenes TaxID=69 RepID=UPI0019D2E4E3|nr:hypothetical protein [Lysobacter enzymogenes]